MKKIIEKISERISKKPLASMLLVFISAVIITSITLFSTDFRNLFVADGVYAIKSSRLIELRGDAELPLYEEAISNMGNEIPDGLALCIYSGFGKYIEGSKFQDLVYRQGVLNGDFYQTSVLLMKRDRGINYYESINCANQFNDQVSDKFNLEDREKMVASACNRLLTQRECDRRATINN